MAKIKSDPVSEQEVKTENHPAWGTDEEIAAFVERYHLQNSSKVTVQSLMEIAPWFDEVLNGN
jgi:hypothetical protein